jgi:hypothetical protein
MRLALPDGYTTGYGSNAFFTVAPALTPLPFDPTQQLELGAVTQDALRARLDSEAVWMQALLRKANIRIS